jgi:hypothetical protein
MEYRPAPSATELADGRAMTLEHRKAAVDAIERRCEGKRRAFAAEYQRRGEQHTTPSSAALQPDAYRARAWTLANGH